MKILKERIDTIINDFNTAVDNMLIMAIYIKGDVNIVMAMKDPNEMKMGLPFYRVYDDGTVTTVPVTSNPTWFGKIVRPENVVYYNQDIEYTTNFDSE